MPRISQLTSLTTVDSGDEFAVVDTSASVTKKATKGDLLKDAADYMTEPIGPELRTGGFALVTKVFSNSTGSQSVTGVGFKPKAIIVGWGLPSSTSGAIISQGRAVDGDPIKQSAESNYNLSTGQAVSNISTTQAIFRIGGSGAAAFAATVTSFDEDGITVDVTTTDSTESTRTFQILFMG